MPARLVALDEGSDIALDRAMIVVGRHPQCDARLDSLRVSRHHCCMTQDHGDVVVRDLGSTNGIRINGLRVETGRLRPGDELSIAHIRYRLDNGNGHEATLADTGGSLLPERDRPALDDFLAGPVPPAAERMAAMPMLLQKMPPAMALSAAAPSRDVSESAVAAAVRGALAPGMADRCRIQVIVRMDDESDGPHPDLAGAEKLDACRPDSSH